MKLKHLLPIVIYSLAALTAAVQAAPLKLHAILTDNMILQRDKPIKIWGWADAGDKISVSFGKEKAITTAAGDAGLWEVTFPAREASINPIEVTASTGDEKIQLENILIGDVWVAHGQSNMAWPLGKTLNADMETQQANLPLLRHFRIKSNEQSTLQTDIRAEAVINGGWEVSTPKTSKGFSAIGYVFGSHLQRATGVPIGIISNARGGASLESMVPGYKFSEHPLAAAYKKSVDNKVANFDARAKALENWERSVQRAERRKVAKDKWPSKPVGSENLSSWNIPGKSPSDAASIYNGMFGSFKGLNIKGVIFHQGYNNAIWNNCRPKRYRVLMKLMVEGWREEFDAPELPVAVIGFCAGSDPQNEENFEAMARGGGSYIRESQRLGLADVGISEKLAFIPAYDVQVPGLHPGKKREHGFRAARWALKTVYGQKVSWETASLTSSEAKSDEMILTFDKSVYADDMSPIPRGFSIAGEDGKFYRAYARYAAKKGQRNWGAARHYNTKTIYLWSPLVEKPVAARYGWATSPAGNLKVSGKPSSPLHSFRTDRWDWPESEDPEVLAAPEKYARENTNQAKSRLETRQTEEAKRAIEILERLKTLGRGEVK
jgi:sialate O-acetylesterase